MSKRGLSYHDLSGVFPLMGGRELELLAADIRANGLREPIVLLDGKVLDGRNRLRACEQVGVEPKTVQYRGKDPLGYVVSLNLRRRHLDESQRALVASRLATLDRGRPAKVGKQANLPVLTQPEAARLLNVAERSVKHARVVQQKGASELVAAVERGEVPVSVASVVAERLPKREQAAVVRGGKREVQQVAKRLERQKTDERRTGRRREIGQAGVLDGKYSVVLADPPWQYSDHSPRVDADCSYPTMTLEEICQLPVARHCTNDGVLFLWTTAPMLQEGLRVLEAWGFEYRAQLVWVKDVMGVGHWVRYRHELLLIGTRGDMPTPSEADRPDSVIEAPRREHSRKPDEVYELIEGMYPELPRVELFARDRRDGWAAWGNEVAADDAA